MAILVDANQIAISHLMVRHKIENEIKPIAARPHPFEYELYFGV